MTKSLRSQRISGLRFIVALVCLAPGLTLSQSVFTHSHLRVPEGQQAAAAAWYHAVLGGEPGEIGPGPGVRYPNGFVGTMPNEGMAGDGAESVIDHVGISVPDVRATVEDWKPILARLSEVTVELRKNAPHKLADPVVRMQLAELRMELQRHRALALGGNAKSAQLQSGGAFTNTELGAAVRNEVQHADRLSSTSRMIVVRDDLPDPSQTSERIVS